MPKRCVVCGDPIRKHHQPVVLDVGGDRRPAVICPDCAAKVAEEHARRAGRPDPPLRVVSR